MHSSPPPANYTALFDTQGFFVLRNVLTEAEMRTLRSLIYSYVDGNGANVRPHAFGNHGGWYIGAVHEEPTLSTAVQLLHGKPRLHAALSQIFHGAAATYRMLSRNEVYIDRSGTWHADTVIGPYRAYTPPALQCDFKRHPYGCLWEPLPRHAAEAEDLAARAAESMSMYGIVTVAAYLEPHVSDSQALHVKPHSQRSHAAQISGWRSSGPAGRDGMILQPSLGDVIIFDTRLVHRGQDQVYAAMRPDRIFRADAAHRGLLSLTYGRENAFTESHDRAFAMRNRLVNNLTLCGGAAFGKCAEHQMQIDLKNRPLARMQ